jgi:hypothetical protein
MLKCEDQRDWEVKRIRNECKEEMEKYKQKCREEVVKCREEVAKHVGSHRE